MRSIRGRLLLSFALLLLLPLTILNFIFTFSSLDQGRAQVLRQLSSLASLKENDILTWEKELTRSVVSIRVREHLDTPAKLPQPGRLDKEILLDRLFEELFIVDLRGRVAVSTTTANIGKVLSAKFYFEGLFTQDYVSPPFYDLTHGTMRVVVATPLTGSSGKITGSLAGVANLKVLDRVLGERTGLGKTGETYLVGTNDTLVTPIRKGERNDLVHIPGVDTVIASQGTWETSYLSDRGESMVATFRWVDSLKVVLVAEQEQSEAYAPWLGILAVTLWIEGLFLLLALISALVVTRSLVRPLDDLARTAQAISGGTLTVQAREDGPREAALVGQAFNAMTTRMRGTIVELTGYKAHLEELVAERTADLVVARNQAQESDRLKSTFLATMSHELRTPLNSIIGFTGILAQGLVGPLNDEQKKQLGFVMNSARHLLDLISDILDISKIEAGQFKVEALEYDLTALVAKAVKSIEPLAQRKNLSLLLEAHPLPGPMRGDPRRVEQVLLNLLSNAVKFTESGRITVQFKAERDFVRVEVADSGSGIRAEDLPKLFKPFQQLDMGLNRLHQGTGLGLSICKRLLDLMGGTIEVTSQPGEGSVFAFTLPLARRTA